MPTPTAKLLENMVLLRDVVIPKIRHESSGDDEMQVEEAVVRAIEETHRNFEAISGFGKLARGYHQAAEIHRGLLEPILTEFPELRRFIPTSYVYYT